ncbi:lambda family phage portal protein [Paramagnetospirillum caucaseum]|uniref:Lambda family phage portal protein n=1 Tax=Paramagnetospirillum caucaseum TaxID=1244869 RepID=M2YEI3_9PROT|nr:phage portal protein [Paramagnetospirillum caucaseum]EME71396.1 lambda family phage portal protein [Paramagnetospirillum caucaseum]
MSNAKVAAALRGLRPTLIDRLVNFVDPVRGTARLRSRAQGIVLSAMWGGGYTGARKDRRALKNADKRDLSADAALLPDLATLRGLSHSMYLNHPLARAAVKRVRTAVVGGGLTFKAKVDRRYLGLSDQEAESWEAAAERLQAMHFQSKFFDSAQERDADQMAASVLISVLLSGDTLVVRRYIEPGEGLRRAALLGTCAQLVDSARLCNPDNRPDGVLLSNGNRVAGGVERDGDGAAQAYWVLPSHPGDLRFDRRPPVRLLAVGESGERLIWHIFAAERAEQSRGEPFLAPVIEPLHQLGKYTEAELTAAVVSGLFTVFVETASGQGMAPVAGAESDVAGEYQLGPGAVLQGVPGDKVTTIDPNRPNVAFDPFVMACLRQVGAALEIPFEVLILHFTASYSAARAAILEAWRFFVRVRSWLIKEFYQPQYEAMLAECIARDLLTAPGFFDDLRLRAAYCGADWVGPPMGQLNPLQETKALVEQVASGLNTRERATAQLGNGDWESNVATLGREAGQMSAAGIIPAAGADPAASSSSPDPAAPPDGGDQESPP